MRQVNLIGSHVGTKSELVQAMRFVESGKIHPVIHTLLPLSKAGKGQLMMESRQVVGKVVLVPPGTDK